MRINFFEKRESVKTELEIVKFQINFFLISLKILKFGNILNANLL